VLLAGLCIEAVEKNEHHKQQRVLAEIQEKAHAQTHTHEKAHTHVATEQTAEQKMHAQMEHERSLIEAAIKVGADNGGKVDSKATYDARAGKQPGTQLATILSRLTTAFQYLDVTTKPVFLYIHSGTASHLYGFRDDLNDADGHASPITCPSGPETNPASPTLCQNKLTKDNADPQVLNKVIVTGSDRLSVFSKPVVQPPAPEKELLDVHDPTAEDHAPEFALSMFHAVQGAPDTYAIPIGEIVVGATHISVHLVSLRTLLYEYIMLMRMPGRNKDTDKVSAAAITGLNFGVTPYPDVPAPAPAPPNNQHH